MVAIRFLKDKYNLFLVTTQLFLSFKMIIFMDILARYMYKYTSTKCSWQHYIFKKVASCPPCSSSYESKYDNPMHAINLLAA